MLHIYFSFLLIIFKTSPTGEVFYVLAMGDSIYVSVSDALQISDSEASESEFWNILQKQLD